MILLVVVLLVLFAASVPIAMSLGMAAVPTLIDRNIPFIAIPQVVFDALDSFALMALPLYVLAGKLMQYGGIAHRLVEFAQHAAIVDDVPELLALEQAVDAGDGLQQGMVFERLVQVHAVQDGSIKTSE